MIDRIKGVLLEKRPTRAVVDCGGVGYGLQIALPTFEKLGEEGAMVSLLTYLHVREDVLQLYGFASETERDLFMLLISVSKIGPKTAQAILSGLPLGELLRALQSGNTGLLSKMPGVGVKTAERLVVEVKGRVEKIAVAGLDSGSGRSGFSLKGGVAEEALSALESLGYKRFQAEKVILRILSEKGSEVTLEELIKGALKIL